MTHHILNFAAYRFYVCLITIPFLICFGFVALLFFSVHIHSVHIISKQKECCSSCLTISRPAEFPAGQTTVFQTRYKHTDVKLFSFPFSSCNWLTINETHAEAYARSANSQNAKPGKDYCMFIIARHLLLSNYCSIVPCYCWSLCYCDSELKFPTFCLPS